MAKKKSTKKVEKNDSRGSEVTKVTPSFLEKIAAEDTSVEELKGYRVLSRIKVVQAMSDSNVKEQFGEGAVVLQPGNALVADPRASFLFVPLFFFVEFISWKDRRDQGGSPIEARSFDKAGDIARKSRSADDRFEVYPGGPKSDPYKMRHVEHLNFAGVIYGDHELGMTPVAISFAKGELNVGKNLCSAALLRKAGAHVAPLWSQVWEFGTATRDRGGNTWWGIDFANPTGGESPFIKEDEVETFKGFHDDLKALHDASRLAVDQGDDGSEGSADSGEF